MSAVLENKNRAAGVRSDGLIGKSMANPQRRQAPRDAAGCLNAVEDAREARVLDANTDLPRYLCIGFGVIRL